MSKEAERNVADFIAGALSPPLIMALVGSLVFFLLEILYQGIYRGVLQWVLFFFVFGAVLIARIAITDTGTRATGYALVLGGAVWAALQLYVTYPDNDEITKRRGVVNFGLIVLIWWSAHRLTRDCTLLDDDEKNEGIGLLEAVGIERPETADDAEKVKKDDAPGLLGWWQRFERYRAKRKKKPRTPGVWVVLFSLAALPLFGLGQSQIPLGEVERRRYCFQLLVVYVGSGLGLLLTTSYLGMRAYLRQRKVTMPLGITAVWLAFGAGLIGAVLLVSDLLPRPADPQPLWEWAGIGSQRRQAAPLAPMKAVEEKKIDASVEQDENGKPIVQAKQEPKSGDSKGEGKNAEGKKSQDRPVEKGAPPAENKVPGMFGPVLDFLLKAGKWFIIVIVVSVIAFWGLRWLLHFLANFTLWARALLAFLDNLRKPREVSEVSEDKPAATPRAFASFSNPFRNGQAEYLSPAELVRYSFAALVAWGREHDLPREANETAGEYAARLGAHHPALGDEAGKLAAFYGRLAYSTDSVSDAEVKTLKHFWRELTEEIMTAAH